MASSQYQRIVKLTKKIQGGRSLPPMLADDESILSKNLKTGYSLNFPIALTCNPTKVCMRLCYGSKPGAPINWDASIAKQLRLWSFFQQASTEEVAQRIIREYDMKELDWLRWNGVGDLFPRSTKVINYITEERPDVRLLVVSRKPQEVAKLNPGPNLYIMFSLDNASRDRLEKFNRLMPKGHPRLFFSFLRENPDDDTMGAQIIFNAHQNRDQLPYDSKRKCCPVDAGVLDIEGGCDSCKKCFTNSILKSSRKEFNDYRAPANCLESTGNRYSKAA